MLPEAFTLYHHMHSFVATLEHGYNPISRKGEVIINQFHPEPHPEGSLC